MDDPVYYRTNLLRGSGAFATILKIGLNEFSSYFVKDRGFFNHIPTPRYSKINVERSLIGEQLYTCEVLEANIC